MKSQILKTSIYASFLLFFTACIEINGTGVTEDNENQTSQVADNNSYNFDHEDDRHFDDRSSESQLSPYCEGIWEESMVFGDFNRFFDECSTEAQNAIEMDPYFSGECREKGYKALAERSDELMMSFNDHCLDGRDDGHYSDEYDPYYCDPAQEYCDDPHYDPYNDPYYDPSQDPYYDDKHNDGPLLSAHCEDLAHKAEMNPTQPNIDAFVADCIHEVGQDSEFPLDDPSIGQQCKDAMNDILELRINDHFYGNCYDDMCDSEMMYDDKLKNNCTLAEMEIIWSHDTHY